LKVQDKANIALGGRSPEASYKHKPNNQSGERLAPKKEVLKGTGSEGSPGVQ